MRATSCFLKKLQRLLDILGEPTTEGTKVYELDDVLEFGKHKGDTLRKVIAENFHWVEWAAIYSEHFFCNIDAVIEERKKTIKVMQPDDIISFGKYKGKTIKEICDIDRNYLIWLANNSSDIKLTLVNCNLKQSSYIQKI